jgi:hypothetical protein
MNFQAPLRNGRQWTFYFDVDEGVSAEVDGQRVGQSQSPIFVSS